MGFSLKDFFDDVIPNEIKKFAGSSAGKVLLGGTAAYLGVKYAPSASRALFGASIPQFDIQDVPYGIKQTSGLFGTGGFKQTMGSVFGMPEYGYDKGILGRWAEKKGGFLEGTSKFIEGMGKDKLSGMLGYEKGTAPTMASQIKSINVNRGVKPDTSATIGSYTSSKTAAPGFNNNSVQSAMSNIMQYYNDIALGRIPSTSYTVEGTKGTTISIPKGATTIT